MINIQIRLVHIVRPGEAEVAGAVVHMTVGIDNLQRQFRDLLYRFF